MTPEENVALLKEAGIWDVIGFPGCIDKLIVLVAARERKKCEQEIGLMEEHCAELILIEREACAKVCEEEITIDDEAFNDGVYACINSIKARGE